ncbi:MAG TPA: hypothetical protein VF054_11835 [Micromonosporaceae bacterium]
MTVKSRLPLAATLLSIVAAVVTVVGISGPAAAVNRYTIIYNAPKPAVCGNSGTIPAGTWLQNKPCGYFVGIALGGTSYDVHETNPSNYHYGRNYGNNNFCAWIPPGALSGPTATGLPASCGSTVRDNLLHRRTFGYNFNAPANTATDGSPIQVNTGCGAYYNYFTSSYFTSGSLHDFAGYPQSWVYYRYTANGSGAIAVRDPGLGWIFLSPSCVTNWNGVAFYNDND